MLIMLIQAEKKPASAGFYLLRNELYLVSQYPFN